MDSSKRFAAHLLSEALLLGLVACFSMSFAAPSMHAQSLYDFDSLASDVARQIETSPAGSAHASVLVTDFEELNVPDSQLGVVLAQNFSHSLRAHAGNFTVLDRIDTEDAISNHKLPSGALSSRTITACYAPDLGATLVVGGRIEYTPEDIILDLDVRPFAQDDRIFGKRIITPLTPAMEELKSKRAAGTQAIFEEDKTVWARDESSKTSIPAAVAGQRGYSYPTCIHCGQAQYTGAAVRAKITGTVMLSAVIGPDGKAQRILVLSALPCGLDQRAIEAIEDWIFRPATGPDGKPAAVVQTIEVSFHLY
jgi:TonB family protein